MCSPKAAQAERARKRLMKLQKSRSAELAKRLAREDHEAEIAARQASAPATTKKP
jgi:hypothetical protein